MSRQCIGYGTYAALLSRISDMTELTFENLTGFLHWTLTIVNLFNFIETFIHENMQLSSAKDLWPKESLAQGLFPQSLKQKFCTYLKVKINWTLQTTDQYLSCQSSVKFTKKFFIADSIIISPQIIYHPYNLTSDQEQALNMLY